MTGIDSSAQDGHLDHYARLVRRLLQVPTAMVTLVEQQRQVFPGVSGLPEPYLSARETPLSHSFCQYVVVDQQPLRVLDARVEPRLADSQAIVDQRAVAYADGLWSTPTGSPSDRCVPSTRNPESGHTTRWKCCETSHWPVPQSSGTRPGWYEMRDSRPHHLRLRQRRDSVLQPPGQARPCQ